MKLLVLAAALAAVSLVACHDPADDQRDAKIASLRTDVSDLQAQVEELQAAEAPVSATNVETTPAPDPGPDRVENPDVH